MLDKPYTWSTPIDSGICNIEVRNTLPYKLARYNEEMRTVDRSLEPPPRRGAFDRKQRGRHAEPLQPLPPSPLNNRAFLIEDYANCVGHGAATAEASQVIAKREGSPLVYSSISDTKHLDHVKRIDLYPISARIIREPIYRTGLMPQQALRVEGTE